MTTVTMAIVTTYDQLMNHCNSRMAHYCTMHTIDTSRLIKNLPSAAGGCMLFFEIILNVRMRSNSVSCIVVTFKHSHKLLYY